MSDSQASNPKYTEQQIAAIERSLSQDRLRSYLADAGGDKCKAIVMHEQNTEISEAIFGVIQGLEISLRNTIHRTLQKGVGQDAWYDAIPMQEPEIASIIEAQQTIEGIGKTITVPRMISRLGFGFWVRLTGTAYEKTVWVPHLYRVFPMRMIRSLLYKRLWSIKELRNEIAHHERITKRNTKKDYDELLETIRWVCPRTAEWVKATNRVEKLIQPPPTTLNLPNGS